MRSGTDSLKDCTEATVWSTSNHIPWFEGHRVGRKREDLVYNTIYGDQSSNRPETSFQFTVIYLGPIQLPLKIVVVVTAGSADWSWQHSLALSLTAACYCMYYIATFCYTVHSNTPISGNVRPWNIDKSHEVNVAFCNIIKLCNYNRYSTATGGGYQMSSPCLIWPIYTIFFFLSGTSIVARCPIP